VGVMRPVIGHRRKFCGRAPERRGVEKIVDDDVRKGFGVSIFAGKRCEAASNIVERGHRTAIDDCVDGHLADYVNTRSPAGQP